VLFRVRDEGPGIQPEEMPKLFKKFSKLSARPTGGEGSTGLGLSITSQLCQRMQGRIWCESQPGQGSTFSVEFPKCHEMSAATSQNVA
jgi:signal transduction histidine kinase